MSRLVHHRGMLRLRLPAASGRGLFPTAVGSLRLRAYAACHPARGSPSQERCPIALVDSELSTSPSDTGSPGSFGKGEPHGKVTFPSPTARCLRRRAAFSSHAESDDEPAGAEPSSDSARRRIHIAERAQCGGSRIKIGRQANGPAVRFGFCGVSVMVFVAGAVE